MQHAEQKQYAAKLLKWIVLAAAVSLAAAPLLTQWLDTSLMFSWSKGFAEGYFNAYDGHVPSLDYPPLYFPVLWVIGMINKAYPLDGLNGLIQLLFKIVPITFYMLSVWCTYRIACRYAEPKKAYRAALFMLLCPTLFVNSAYWAQMDCILIFFVLWFFYLLDCDRPYAATVVFVLCGIMKLQTLFFLPVFVAYLIYRYKVRQVIRCGLMGIGLAYAAFIPFMISTVSGLYAQAAADGLSFFPALFSAIGQSAGVRSGVLLPFHLYFGSFNSYQFASMNAFNLWTACGLNMQGLADPLIGGAAWLTPAFIGNLFMAAALLFPFVYLFVAKKRGWEADVWMLALVVMQTIYIFATKMHDRYQIVVLPLLLMIWLKKNDRSFAKAFWFTAGMTCINHLMTIITYTDGTTQNFFFHGAGAMVYIVLSMANLVLYAYTIYLCLPYLFPKAKPESGPQAAA